MIKTQLVIVQATPFCNINCRYCYLPQRSVTKRISFATVSQIFKRFFASPFVADEITVVWHAGEPLVLPCSFYEQAFRCIEAENINNVRVQHSFQTNATLIDQQWCDFFRREQVQVSVSLDGPGHIHDAQRVDRAGKGTFEKTMRGVRHLQANALPFSAIAVITRQTLSHAQEFWQFFMQLRPARLGLNPEETEGINIHSSLQNDEDIERYKAFFKTLLTLNANTQEPLVIREAEALTGYIRNCTPFIRTQTNVAGAIFSFDSAGNISTFSPELLTTSHTSFGTFTFGNVFDMSLDALFEQPKFRAVQQQIEQGVHKCIQTCDYFTFCGGGCPANKIFENGSFNSTETRTCRLRVKAATSALLEHLEEHYHIIPAGVVVEQ